MAFFRSSFIKLPKHKQFSYQPRYFDPEKEQRNGSVEDRINFRESSRVFSKARHEKARSQKTVLILAAVLALLIFLILR